MGVRWLEQCRLENGKYKVIGNCCDNDWQLYRAVVQIVMVMCMYRAGEHRRCDGRREQSAAERATSRQRYDRPQATCRRRAARFLRQARPRDADDVVAICGDVTSCRHRRAGAGRSVSAADGPGGDVCAVGRRTTAAAADDDPAVRVRWRSGQSSGLRTVEDCGRAAPTDPDAEDIHVIVVVVVIAVRRQQRRTYDVTSSFQSDLHHDAFCRVRRAAAALAADRHGATADVRGRGAAPRLRRRRRRRCR